MACGAETVGLPLSPGGIMVCGTLRYDREPQPRKKMRPSFHEEEHQAKREEEDDREQERQPLLPGLPDDIAQLCLSRVSSPRLLFTVCRSWRRLLYSPSFPPFLSLYALLSSSSSPASIELQAFDPVAAAWQPVPSHPQLQQLLVSHPGFLSRSLPVQSVSAAGRLVFLAATTHSLLPALPRPLLFDPATSQWHLAPPLLAPRRWCAAGAADDCIYVVSGHGCGYSPEVARSVERWDPDPDSTGAGRWEQRAPLRDGRFSREAADAVACSGKLCMVNVRGRAAKEGAVYDIAGDRWEEMPRGMLAGWTGPVAGAGKDDRRGTIYVVDELEGILSAYDRSLDKWNPVAKSELLRDAVHVTAGGGRVCVACAGGKAIVVVDISTRPARTWVVEPPAGKKVIGLHVLPRPSRPEETSPPIP